ncbi:hypothetical protein RY972_21065 [Aeromonas allosaccharophila]|uniref:Uncharacterized protein n=1 Tax=Aeromonas allosaccharophila TaxID=656 RepID=A0ABZ0FAA6_9GAMM|nr:hypothetical protein [Aeromonas allosaccharophila]WOE66442.1 hypothetical protein RY972_21065 [Aeromonas allosaccharophila]
MILLISLTIVSVVDVGGNWGETGTTERREQIARPFALCHADGYQGIGSAFMGISRSGMRLVLLLSALLLPLMGVVSQIDAA